VGGEFLASMRGWVRLAIGKPEMEVSIWAQLGIFIFMSELTVSTQVAAPLERTFQAFTNLEKAVERVPAITAVEILSEGPFGEGTRWRETRLMFKKEATEEMWVTGFNPPNSYTVEAESHGMKYSTLFEFTTVGDGTKVTWTFTGKALTLGAKIMAPIFNVLMKGMMRKCMLGDLEAIRDACESGES
jgi:carbon monoxide dehydrogenase subunit G